MNEIEMIVLPEGSDVAFGEKAEWCEFESDEAKAKYEKFYEDFEHIGYNFLADPNEDFYQGQSHMSVWERKSDGKLFGFQYWQGGGKYGEPYIEPNGDEYGFGYGVYVLLPVKTFTITGYMYDDQKDS